MDTIKRATWGAFACGLILAAVLPAQKIIEKKKKKEEITQTLQLPRDLPITIAADTRRLVFLVTPLSSKGLLSAQVRDALRALTRVAGANTVLRIRAFTAGSGDLRRVRDLVSEVFTEHRLPLPVLSLVQSGGLPLEGAQVVLEAVAAAKKDVNPQGLAFIPAPVATSGHPLDPIPPLAAKSLEELKLAVTAAGSDSSGVLRVTCFLSSLDDLAATRKLVDAEYPRSVQNYVQTQRAPGRALAACEAVARLKSDPGKPVQYIPAEGNARAVLVHAPHLILTGTQVSYGYQESDSSLAFERLQKSLDAAAVTGRDVVFAQYYPLAEALAAQVRKLRPKFFPTPATSLITFEGLPSMDAGFAVDVIAVKQ